MKVTLPAELARYVEEQVAGGRYATADAVVEEGLRLLRRRQERDRRKLEDLRREIQIGIDEADRGELAPLDARATLKRVRAARAQRKASDGQGAEDATSGSGPGGHTR